MKSFLPVCALLVVVALVGLWLFDSQKSEAEKLHQRIAALERELSEAKSSKSADAVPKPVPPTIDTPPRATVAVPPPATTNELSPAEQSQLDELNVRRFQRTAARQYGEAMNRLSLDPATREKVLALFAKAMQAQADTGYAARKAGITDPAAIRERAMQEVARADAETREALGPELFQALQWEAWVNQERTTSVHNFSIEAAAVGSPLTADQSDALARVFAENKTASQRGMLATPEEAESALFENAAKVLSPAQFEFFRRSRLDDAQLAILNRKLTAKK